MTGVDIIDFVQESQLENRFYHDPRATELTKNITEQSDVDTKLTQRAKAKRHFGTYVSPKTRKTMFNILRDMVHDYRHLIYTKYLVKDICNLVQQKNGSVAAASGEHDDLVMAYLHTIYVLKYGHELGRFGIDKSLCTYDKSIAVMKEYEQSIQDDIVDNTKPYDCPTMYEEQLLHDLTSDRSFSGHNGIDAYGLKRDQYNVSNRLQNTEQESVLSRSDLAYFREINSFW